VQHGFNVLHRYSLGVFAVLFLLVGSSGVQVGAAYWSAHIPAVIPVNSNIVRIPPQPTHGLSTVIFSNQLTSTLQRITNQPLNLTFGDKTVAVSPSTIKSWIQVTIDHQHNVAYLHVDPAAISSAITQQLTPLVTAATNQVTATYADGSSAVIVTGRNGTAAGDTSQISAQIADQLLQTKGFQLTVPQQTVPFQAVTPAAFNKLLEVNVVTKQMYAYDKGQLTRTFPISAGAPATPTPLGQYSIYEKLTVQDMTGLNADGSKYLQPHVHWINYFLPGGYAVHGNYWRPLSVFGAVNTSHGCVSLPDDQAEWVYDWAPIGTTVITHA
jgi:lipoprotein-anchoring transpeptidase ErfK/SrfK